MKKRIEVLIKMLGREQDQLYITPSLDTPYRLLEIAEMKRILGALKVFGDDQDLIRGYLQGLYYKTTQPVIYNEAEIKSWYKVAIYLYPKKTVEQELSDIEERKIAQNELNTPLTLKYLFQKLLNF